MKRTKRQESSIIIHFTLYVIFIIVLIYLLVFKVLPSIKEIEEVKADVQNTYSGINIIEKEGIGLLDFKENVEKVKKSDNGKGEEGLYFTEILKSIEDDFYNEHLKNTSDTDYSQFIEDLNKKYLNNSDFEDKTSIIGNVLPVYSEDISDLGNNSLSDYKFINYIESISEVFNIRYDASIGISELALLEDYAVGGGSSTLDTNIFYIPLSMQIEGTKESIINFLYFIENIGKIGISGDSNVEVLRASNKDFSDFKYITLTKQDIDKDYNIFNNQIFDIKSISFDEYIDSSFELSNNKNSFISNLKSSQGDEKMKANVKLRFYVKGIPVFKIENYIKQFVKDFSKIKADIEKIMSTVGQDTPKYKRVLEMNNKLNLLQTNIVSGIQKKLNSKENLDETYKQVTLYTELINEYKKYLEDFNK